MGSRNVIFTSGQMVQGADCKAHRQDRQRLGKYSTIIDYFESLEVQTKEDLGHAAMSTLTTEDSQLSIATTHLDSRHSIQV